MHGEGRVAPASLDRDLVVLLPFHGRVSLPLASPDRPAQGRLPFIICALQHLVGGHPLARLVDSEALLRPARDGRRSFVGSHRVFMGERGLPEQSFAFFHTYVLAAVLARRLIALNEDAVVHGVAGLCLLVLVHEVRVVGAVLGEAVLPQALLLPDVVLQLLQEPLVLLVVVLIPQVLDHDLRGRLAPLRLPEVRRLLRQLLFAFLLHVLLPFLLCLLRDLLLLLSLLGDEAVVLDDCKEEHEMGTLYIAKGDFCFTL